MPNGLIDVAVPSIRPSDRRFYGVTVAKVIDNVDSTGQGRVQLDLPWLPGVNPWARVAVLMAGKERGTYFIPQNEEEVLVAFDQGDIREPYVIGCLWNGQDPSPMVNPEDAIHRRIIRTPKGHEIEFDDQNDSITITSSTKHTIRIEPKKIEITTTDDKGSITLDTDGNVSIEAETSIKLKAPKISLEGNTVELTSTASTRLHGGGKCQIKAGLVEIN